jgi:hypothetical protein
MELGEQLAAELTDLARKVGKAEQEGAFNADYERLLGKLTAAMKAMRQLAIAQGAFLQAKLGQRGKLN